MSLKLLVQQRHAQNLLEDWAEDALAAVGITAVLGAAVVAVLVASLKALTEIVLILA